MSSPYNSKGTIVPIRVGVAMYGFLLMTIWVFPSIGDRNSRKERV